METTATKLKFTAQQEDLLVLKHLANIAKANGINPILQYVNLEPISNTELKAWVTNLDITMSTIIPVQMDEQEELSLNAQKLYEVINTMTGVITFDDANLKSKGKSGKVLNRTNEKMPYKDITGTDYEVNAKEFINQLKRTVYACREVSNSILSGVLVDGTKLVATDGTILVANTLTVQVLDEQIILPSKFVEELVKVFANADTLTLTTDKGAIKVTDGVTTIISRLLEGTYPKYQQLIPTSMANTAVIYRLALLDALSFADPMIHIKTNIAKLNFTQGQLEISTNSEDGESNATIDIDYTGEDMLIAFNAQYLNKMLKSYNSSTIKIGMNSNLSAALITDGVSEDVALIMPIQLSNKA